MSFLHIIRKAVFELPLKEAEFAVRKFNTTGTARERLELVAKTVVTGYNTAATLGRGNDLLIHRQQVKDELVGFYNEGIGMGLYALDLFTPGGHQFWDFVATEGRHHQYMSYIGAGLASGVFRKDFNGFVKKADPTCGLLILNGIGFHNAYFRSQKTIEKQVVPASVTEDPFYLYCYDNGIGRALWFYKAGDPDAISTVINAFPAERRQGLWAGVGLAATYACGVSAQTLLRLRDLAGVYRCALAEGSVLATHTRHIAGNLHDDENASLILVGKPVSACTQYAAQAKERLNGQRFIEGKHSLNVFINDIAAWTKSIPVDVKSALAA
jgi:hypothetical protein